MQSIRSGDRYLVDLLINLGIEIKGALSISQSQLKLGATD